MKEHWIKTAFASLVLATLLAMVFEQIPFFPTFFAILTIFAVHVVWGQIGSETKKIWDWVWSVRHAISGVILFLAIRYIVGMAFDLYPVDSVGNIKKSGGLWNGILLGRNTSKVFLWELTLAFIIGQITAMWVNGNGTQKFPVRVIIVGSWLVFTFQIFFPTYATTWPSREVVSTNLVNHGVIGTAFKGTRTLLFGKPIPTPAGTNTARVVASRTVTESVEALVLMYEGITPCSTKIDYVAQIRWGERRPLLIKFPGIDQPIEFPGEGAFKAPKEITSDKETEFVSADPNNLHFRVQVFKKITIPKQ